MLYCLSGCTDERWQENGGSAENVGGLPIEFIMDLAPVTPSSRTDVANVEIGEKTKFAREISFRLWRISTKRVKQTKINWN